jgi:hypothetical protein
MVNQKKRQVGTGRLVSGGGLDSLLCDCTLAFLFLINGLTCQEKTGPARRRPQSAIITAEGARVSFLRRPVFIPQSGTIVPAGVQPVFSVSFRIPVSCALQGIHGDDGCWCRRGHFAGSFRLSNGNSLPLEIKGCCVPSSEQYTRQ